MQSRRLQFSLVVTALVIVLGSFYSVSETVPIASVVAAAGLIWSTRRLGAWLMAGGFLLIGLIWQLLMGDYQCSPWGQARIVIAKLSGAIPLVGWEDVWKGGTTRQLCYGSSELDVALLDQKSVDGHIWEQYATPLGKFWVPAPGEPVSWEVWELLSQSVYESRNVSIRPGDVVIDCGAHVGVFTRFALRQGASRVIAIEPDPTNVACIRENLVSEIDAGRVDVVPAGVWDERKRIPLFVSEESSDVHTFVSSSGARMLVPHSSESRGAEDILVLPLDEIVDELALDRVDFVKMDIEGAERNALQGARKTLIRFKPRMAICVYHRDDDPVVVPGIIQETRSDYSVHGKLVETGWGKVRPKVLYFD